MNKPYNNQNTNICNGIFHISFFKALLINEGETTRGEMESGRLTCIQEEDHWGVAKMSINEWRSDLNR
jgi:hypothetical protein